MLSVYVMSLLALVVQAHAEELAAAPHERACDGGKEPESDGEEDRLWLPRREYERAIANQTAGELDFVDVFANRWIDKLVDRALKVSPTLRDRRADLEITSLGKPGHVVIQSATKYHPGIRSLSRGIPSIHAARSKWQEHHRNAKLLSHGAKAADREEGSMASPLPPLKAAVIIPGFLSDARDFSDLAALLTARGLPTAVAPMSLTDWVPVIGGRSVRPVLDRIDLAVRHVAAMGKVAEASRVPLTVPSVSSYGIVELLQDFLDNPGGVAAVGGSVEPDEFPADISPRGVFPAAPPERGRIALIGHSAGGYIGRIYCSSRSYGGKAYDGSQFVHSLVTLGTPHAQGMGVPFVHVKWANAEPIPPGLRVLAVGGSATPGTGSGALTEGSYSFCTANGTGGAALDGDGITPTFSAIDLPGAESMVLPGVTHYPFTAAGVLGDVFAPELTEAYRQGKPWYGSDSDAALQRWLPWLLDGIK